jgi:hypothetical protein
MTQKPDWGILGVKLVEAGVLHERIALRAYQLYEARGRGDGLDLQDWLEAEQEITSQLQQADKATALGR